MKYTFNTNFKLVDNIYKKMQVKKYLYHYHIPKYGYCLYNFDNIKSETAYGYIIINLNDILPYYSIIELLNNGKTKLVESVLSKNLACFNTISKYSEENYKIVYYLSISNMLKKYGNNDDIIKKNIINKCNLLTELLNRFIPELNLIISYQFDKFHIRNTYYTEFIDSYIKNNVKYIAVNYDNNKFLVGKYYKLDLENIHKYINNNFLACYKNNLHFVEINNILNNSESLNNNLIGITLDLETESINISDIISNVNLPVYKDEQYKLSAEVYNYKYKLNDELNKYMKDIELFFKNTINDCSGTVIIGANLDYNYDDIIISNLHEIILSLGKEKVKQQNNINFSGNKTILEIINSYSTGKININKINIINVSGKEINKTLLETTKANIIRGAYNILVNINLTSNMFDEIYKYIVNNTDYNCSNIYYDFEINKRLRLSLGYHIYYKNFIEYNNISSNCKYNTNWFMYAKLRNFIKYVNNYTIKDLEKKDYCICQKKHNINYYKIQYLPYLADINFLKDIDHSLFL
jgi:hypothetical protein